VRLRICLYFLFETFLDLLFYCVEYFRNVNIVFARRRLDSTICMVDEKTFEKTINNAVSMLGFKKEDLRLDGYSGHCQRLVEVLDR